MLKMLITLILDISVRAFLSFVAMCYGHYFHSIRALLNSCSTGRIVKCLLARGLPCTACSFVRMRVYVIFFHTYCNASRKLV